MSSSPPHDQNSACQRDIDRDQRGGDEGDLGLQQPEPAIDILGEDPKKRSMTPVPPMAHSLSDWEMTASPAARGFRLYAARAPGD